MLNHLLSRVLTACALLFVVPVCVLATGAPEAAATLLPDRVGDVRALGVGGSLQGYGDQEAEDAFEVESAVFRNYRSATGEKFRVELVKTRTDKGAYSLFSTKAQNLSDEVTRLENVGTAAFISSSGRLLVYKGMAFLDITTGGSEKKNSESLIGFARLLAESFDKGEGEIPVLLKHLPESEATQRPVYTISLGTLQEAVGARPALDSVDFAGGTDAVAASYGPSRLVIVEHTTPQMASDNDARINARINELKAGRQPVPSAYRRVGNYSVFVFDAPDEMVANQLIDKVAYEQVVQWLGTNPRLFERAEREYRRTTAGVIVAVIKAAAISLLVCLGIGGIFGSIVFRRRKAQQATTEAYTDAGGMIRLNLDEMTSKIKSTRLLGRGDRPI